MNVYVPSARPVYGCGELHADALPVVAPGPSSLHSNVDPASDASNVKVALVTLIVPLGPSSIEVLGAVASTVNERVAGDGSSLPAASRALTVKVYAPSARPVYGFGELHADALPVVAPGPSSSHSNVDPASDPSNVNEALLTLIVPLGPSVDRGVGRGGVDGE